MALSRKTSRAVRKYGPTVNRLARNRYHISGKQLLADLVQGESGDNPGAVSSAGAKGLTQFMPGTAQSFEKAYGINPYHSADEALHAAALHLMGALGHSKGLEGYNPGGGQAYVNYILGQHAQLAQGKGSRPNHPAGAMGAKATYTRGPSTTKLIAPAIDNSQARKVALLNYFQNLRGQPGALIQIAQTLQGLQDVPAQTKTVRGKLRKVKGTGAPGSQPNARDYSPKAYKGTATFDGKRVAAWIKPALQYARAHGWKGTVSSGFRSYKEQYNIYYVQGIRPAAVPGTSNHEGSQFPRGAVDVTDAPQLSQILKNSPYAKALIWAGSKDPVHFSHPHNGGY